MLGGGAAGATAAKLLAQWGHSVRLITRPAADSRLAVSLPPSCRKLFETIGVNEVVDEAGFVFGDDLAGHFLISLTSAAWNFAWAIL